MRYILSDELKKKKRLRLSPGTVLALGFALIIFAGSILLFLPFSNTFEQHTASEYFDCLFTAASCVCVTGLSTLTVAQSFSFFGQLIMLLLIQIGGLGFMTVGVLFARILRRRLTPREQIIAAQASGFELGINLRKLINDVLRRTAIFEGIGVLLLSAQMWKYSGSFWQTVWNSVFHAVSAFCNAGFDLFTFENGSLTGMAENPYILTVLMLLIAIGGIGFVVWDDVICRIKDRADKLSVYTRFVLIVSAVLFLSGALFTFFTERDNPETIGSLGLFDQIVNSCFYSVSLRTAGFTTFPNAVMRDPQKLMSCLMMFIGGCSGSTAGGVKVGTVGIILFAVFRFSFGRKNLNIWRHSIDPQVFLRAVSLFFIALIIVLSFTGLFCALEDRPVIDLMFEAASALGTVGLSASLTPVLGLPTKILIILLMYFGRVGVLTVTTSFTARSTEIDYGLRYPNTAFYVG